MFRLALEPNHGAALTHVLLCVGCWALIPILAARLGATSLDPSRYLFWSNAVSVVVLLIATSASGRVRAFSSYRAADLAAIAGLGFLGAFAYYALLYEGYHGARTEDTGSLIIVQYTWPVLTTLLSGLVLREAFTRRASIGVALGILAVVCAFGGAAVPPVRHLMIVAVAAITWAVFSVLSKTRGFEPFTYVTLLFVAGAGWSALWMASSSSWGVPETVKDWVFVGLNGAVANGLSYVWYQRALRLAPAAFVAPWVSATPMLAATVNAAFGATLAPGHWLGVVLVLASAWCTIERRPRSKDDLPAPPPVEVSHRERRAPTPDDLAVVAPVGRYRYH